MVLNACGAYGRTYSKTDWIAGKDMKIITGPYFSIRDIERLKAEGYTHIQFSWVEAGEVCNTLYTLP